MYVLQFQKDVFYDAVLFSKQPLGIFFIYLLCINRYQLQLLFLYKSFTDKMSVSTHLYVITAVIACWIIFKWFGNQMDKTQSQWRHSTCIVVTYAQIKSYSFMMTTTTLFVCFNPYCNSRLKCFANEKGYTMDFELLPSCFQYFCKHGKASLKPPAVSLTVGRKRNDIVESYNATFTTTNARRCFVTIWSMACNQQYRTHSTIN